MRMSFHLVTMAKDAGTGPVLLLGNLPEEIVASEILIRLPPKAILRCRAVCRAWRRIASARSFLLAHHRRQLSLHLAYACKHPPLCHEILTIDHQAAAAAQAQLQPVLQLSRDYAKPSLDGSNISLLASCDGLLVLSIGRMGFFICNPATRQFVRLNLHGFNILALYLHRPTSEYQLLLGPMPQYHMAIDRDLCYVLTLGSDQEPRCIGSLKAESMCDSPVLVRGNLHWTYSYDYEQHQRRNEMMITVFDTTSESFRQMRAPMVTDDALLFEMDDMVGIYSCSEDMTIVNIWVMEDYEREVWSLVRQIKLPVAEIRSNLEGRSSWDVMATYDAGNVLLLVDCGTRVLHVDTEGKLLSSSNYDGHSLYTIEVKLKQSLVRHIFFSRLQGDVKAWPFI
ncbi:unnamed protein product [Alopecurus aequalis]